MDSLGYKEQELLPLLRIPISSAFEPVRSFDATRRAAHAMPFPTETERLRASIYYWLAAEDGRLDSAEGDFDDAVMAYWLGTTQEGVSRG